MRRVLLFFFLCNVFLAKGQDKNDIYVPEINREFRAAWVATVANINWPSEPGLDVVDQKLEALNILDSLSLFNFNAVVFQVRPQGDALYNSSIEPWSYFLTGVQGQGPEPYYDPLAFWIEESHKRGMELHVWLNPYRIHHISAPEPSELSMVSKLSEAAVKLKEGYWWLDPAKKITQEHTLSVVKDILLRYDIDGVHFDDYFYPYDSYNAGEDFPDDESWQGYRKEGGLLSRNDWRRDAVNTFVRDVYYLIKSYKPFVKFGLSPFGIWRPGYPESIEGMDQYDKLYADAKLWLNYGWVDYFSPQLYWPINQAKQSYPVLLQWWQSENTHNRYVWPGINDYRMTDDLVGANELHNQIIINRAICSNGSGVIHWSVGSFLKNKALQVRTQESIYNVEALVPPLDWLKPDSVLDMPDLLEVNVGGEAVSLSWRKVDQNMANITLVQLKYGDVWENKVVGESHLLVAKEKEGKPLGEILISFVDRYGIKGESKRILIN